MFWASSCPSSGATTAVAQPARPRPTALLSPSCDGKPEAATAVVASDGGHVDARNMLSFIQTSGRLEKLAAYCWLIQLKLPSSCLYRRTDITFKEITNYAGCTLTSLPVSGPLSVWFLWFLLHELFKLFCVLVGLYGPLIITWHRPRCIGNYWGYCKLEACPSKAVAGI